MTERPEVRARGYRRFRYSDCGKQFNERSDGVLRWTSDDVQTVLQASCKPVEPVDHESIALTEAVEQSMQLRPLPLPRILQRATRSLKRRRLR